jgi:hypothetical protein
VIDREETALRNTDISFTKSTYLSVILDFMDYSEKGSVFDRDSDDACQVFSVTLGKTT